MYSKKKVLFISHSSAKTGGAEDDFLRLLKYFNSLDNKYEVYAIFPKGNRSDAYSQYCKTFWNIDFSWLPLGNARIKEYLKYLIIGIKELYKLRKILKGVSYDLCLINVSLLFWPIFYNKITRKKSIIFIRENIQNITLRKYYQKIISKLGNYYYCVSEHIKHEFIQNTSKLNIQVLYSSIEQDAGSTITDLEILKKEVGDYLLNILIDDKYFKVLHNASFYKLKNQLLILKALKILVEKDNKINYRVLFLGQYFENDAYYLDILSFINNNNLSDKCYFLGVHNKNTVYDIYKYSNAVVLTSFSEGLPLVMVEALKLGVPFISTNIPGVSEVISNNENGLLVDFSEYSLARAISNLSHDELLRKKISKNGKKLFLDKFNLEKNLKIIDNNIKELLN